MNRSKSKTIRDVIESEDKKYFESGNMLTQMFRKILWQLGIGPAIADKLMNDYLDNPYNGIGKREKDRYNHRGNLIKELGEDKMTWNVFLKALKFLGAIEFEFIIRLRRRKKSTGELITTEHIIHATNAIDDGSSLESMKNARIISGFQSENNGEPPVVLQEPEHDETDKVYAVLTAKGHELVGTTNTITED